MTKAVWTVSSFDKMRLARPRNQPLVVLFYYHLCLTAMVWTIAPYYGANYTIMPNWDFRYIMTLPLAIVLACMVPKFNRPSDFTLALLILVTIVPTLAFFVSHGGSYLYVTFCIIGLLVYDAMRRIPFPLNFGFQTRMPQVVLTSFVFLAGVTLLMIQNFRINSLSAILLDLYLVRSEVVENAHSSILLYMQSWSHTVVLPFLLLYCVIKKRWMAAASVVALSILFFLVLTGKGILFDPIFAVIVYFALRNRKGFSIIFIAISVVILLAFLETYLFGTINISAFFVRRTLFVPVMLNANYHTIFSDLGHVYYSHSVLSFLSDYPFDTSYQKIVGLRVFGSTQAHANTGIFGTGYMHFGYLGIPAFCAVMGLVAAYIDHQPISRQAPAFASAVVSVPSYTIFTSADLFSGMLTNGMLIAVFYCMISPHMHRTT